VIIGYVPTTLIEPVQELPSYFDEPHWRQYSQRYGGARDKNGLTSTVEAIITNICDANKSTWQSVVSSF
jgi:hypothetical protein